MQLIAVDSVAPDWVNLSALGCLVACMLWGITKGIPNLIDTFVSETGKQRDDFREDSAKQRDDFRDEMREHRQQSRDLATSGHKAVNGLADAFNDLKETIERGQT